MPNLVGIGLSQVPTNSMLGGLAYQDPEHASIKDLDLKNLSQINSEISDTAVDVFVYDTRKDSDGGAWRKRTQHTSWYNETLNTSTRGSRKEFPAVAVIVSTSSGVTIYDGDDPDLPMWMVFEDTAYDMINTHNLSPSSFSLSAKNGNLLVGTYNSNYGEVNVINFISDSGVSYYSSHSGDYRGSISQRNDALSQTINSNYGTLVNSVVNDIAMTVLPNAPIDSVTGLPIPTIAVATDGGVSVIKDDGTVASSAGDAAGLVEYLDNNYILITRDNNTGYFAVHNNHFTSGSWNANANSYYSLTTPPFNQSGYINGLAASENGYFGNNIGVHIYDALSSSSTNTKGLFSNITASYNTGYMVGDIKGAFLSDTDTTNAIEYVQNGYFNSDVSSWTIGSTGTTATLSANRLLITAPSSGSSWGYVYQGITTEIGKTYKISLHYDRGNVDGRILVRNDSSNTVAGSLFYADLGTSNDGKTYWNTFTATATTTYILLYSKSTSGGTNAYDQISVTLEKDRSINNKGLNVFGTVTKSAVATGADLVAYSGFSANNYLQQPYNSDLNFGTGDFSLMNWIYVTAGGDYQVVFDRWSPSGGNARFYYGLQTDEKIYFHHREDASANATDLTGSTVLTAGVWHHMAAVRRGVFVEVYLNGKLDNSTTQSSIRNVTPGSTQPILRIGNNAVTSPSDPMLSKLALLRISGDAPTPEQIKKIYEDEKVLFEENSKATLYGSSDAVTALAYDDSTNLLYAGTSAGRSEFQGLCRINNTTTAVTTAISASNGLVAEQ